MYDATPLPTTKHAVSGAHTRQKNRASPAAAREIRAHVYPRPQPQLSVQHDKLDRDRVGGVVEPRRRLKPGYLQ